MEDGAYQQNKNMRQLAYEIPICRLQGNISALVTDTHIFTRALGTHECTHTHQALEIRKQATAVHTGYTHAKVRTGAEQRSSVPSNADQKLAYAKLGDVG